MLALTEWEADRCSCGCGQAMSECLVDSTIPLDQRPTWQAAYMECAAGQVLEAAIATQADTDAKRAEQTGKPVPTAHRLWVVQKGGEA